MTAYLSACLSGALLSLLSGCSHPDGIRREAPGECRQLAGARSGVPISAECDGALKPVSAKLVAHLTGREAVPNDPELLLEFLRWYGDYRDFTTHPQVAIRRLLASDQGKEFFGFLCEYQEPIACDPGMLHDYFEE